MSPNRRVCDESAIEHLLAETTKLSPLCIGSSNKRRILKDMDHVFRVEDKYQQLRMRNAERRKLGQHIDNIVRQAEDADRPKGLLSVCFPFLNRWRGRQSAVRTVKGAAATVPSATPSASNTEFNRAVFGLAGVKKGDPAAKLEEAAAVMRGRIESLDARASEQRLQAITLQKAGQKAQALRALKKAKQIEAQVASNQAALDAVEQQVDMIAQAAMHKTLTSALASTSKTMKADGKMLSKAESAIDDATEARDMATDLNGVMAEFAANGVADLDDDDLMMELEQMVDGESPPPADDQVDLKQREQERVTREALASMPSAPTNGVGKKSAIAKEETTMLLDATAQSSG